MKLLAALLALAAPSALWFESQDPSTSPPKGAQASKVPDPLSCEKCHVEIHAEWSGTLHAKAWTDPIYQKAVAEVRERRRPACFGCHIPEPVQVSGIGLDAEGRPERPDPRDAHRDLGIHCTACHADAAGVMHGPFGGAASAHESKKDARFIAPGSSDLCMTCHSTPIGPVLELGRDFARYREKKPEAACVVCHMEEKERKVAVDAELKSEIPVRKGRSHTLRGPSDPEFLKKAFEIRLERATGGAKLVFQNAGVGHRTPGLLGRVYEWQWKWLDASGKDVGAAGEGKLVPEEALQPGTERAYDLGAVPAGATHLAVRGALRLFPEDKTTVAFLDQKLELPH